MSQIFLRPLASAFSLASKLRLHAYETGMIKSFKVAAPVISIGNITAGGTGKTPTVDFLLKHCHDVGIFAGVVSRGYGAKNPGPTEVSDDPQEFGDEPTMLKWKNPDTPIVIGRDRVSACEFLLDKFKSIQVIIADDAFQHLKLKRDLNIVILDATEPISNYRPLPLGRARENFNSLTRADFVLINKTNLSSPENLHWLEEKILVARPDWLRQPKRILRFGYKISALKTIKSGELVSLSNQDRYFLFSGIGRSATFKDLVIKNLKLNVVGEQHFPDHYAYNQQTVDQILMASKRSGATRLLTTEKDAVKIKSWVNGIFDYTQLRMAPEVPPDFLYEQIDSLVN